jgi:iron complex transport system substrate-binding protein
MGVLLRYRLGWPVLKHRGWPLLLVKAGAFGRTHGSFDNICREARVVNGAGLLNLKKGEHLSKEQIVSLNPDVIICSQSSEKSDMYHRVLNDPAFKEILRR